MHCLLLLFVSFFKNVLLREFQFLQLTPLSVQTHTQHPFFLSWPFRSLRSFLGNEDEDGDTGWYAWTYENCNDQCRIQHRVHYFFLKLADSTGRLSVWDSTQNEQATRRAAPVLLCAVSPFWLAQFLQVWRHTVSVSTCVRLLVWRQAGNSLLDHEGYSGLAPFYHSI